MSNSLEPNSQLPTSGGECDTTLRSAEHFFEITIISSTVQQQTDISTTDEQQSEAGSESLSNHESGSESEYTPTFEVVVACGDVIQKGNQIATVARDITTCQWNRTFRFAFEAGKADGITTFTISLFRNDGEKQTLLGRITKYLSQIDQETDITEKFFATQASIKFRVGNASIFALIIGIDRYLHVLPLLEGAVNDAKDMERLLVDDYKVPESNLHVLYNEYATRQKILDGIRTHLLDNSKIKQGDAMIIFFAGHGNRVPAPKDWYSSDGEIETICPYDEDCNPEEGTNSSEKLVTGIPDYLINESIRRLATKKGNNIALIFDSCHSGGIARNEENKDDYLDNLNYTPRSFPNPCPIDIAADAAFLEYLDHTPRGAYKKLPAGFKHEDMASHVLLAACKPKESSFEAPVGNTKRGCFSSQFIPKLRELARSHRSTTISYLQLVSELSCLRQTPQCHGRNTDCHLFTLGAPVNSKNSCKVKPFIEVGFGAMHGVVKNTEFSIVNAATGENLGICSPSKVLAERSHLPYPPGFLNSEDIEARIHKWNNKAPTLLYVYTGPEDANHDSFAKDNEHSLQRVGKEEDAHVSISINENNQYQFDRLPGFLRGHDIKGASRDIANTLSPVLGAICHFRHHLQRAIQNGPSDKLEIKLLRLTLHSRVAGYRPADPEINLIDTTTEYNNANLSAKDTQVNTYGVEIKNTSSSALFIYVFYFDPADYSIQYWYRPPSSSIPLEREQSLSIGYGANGGDPFTFCLEDGQQEGTGFIAVFASSNYADMKHLVQPSPFKSTPGVDARMVTSMRKSMKQWESLVATITVAETE